MPSNADFITDINKMAEQLGLAIDTAGKSNNDLASLASDLRAKIKDKENATSADQAEKEAAEKAAAEQAEKDKAVTTKKTGHSVAKGKAITTKRGILADGETIKAEDLPGGVERLKDLVESRHVVKH